MCLKQHFYEHKGELGLAVTGWNTLLLEIWFGLFCVRDTWDHPLCASKYLSAILVTSSSSCPPTILRIENLIRNCLLVWSQKLGLEWGPWLCILTLFVTLMTVILVISVCFFYLKAYLMHYILNINLAYLYSYECISHG